jgi:hypothetical protein
MRILFDQGTPAPLRRALFGHSVNGALLRAAGAQFDAFVTTDKNLRHQQNAAGLQLAILVLPTTNWSAIRLHEAEILAAINALRAGDVVDLNFS